MNDRIIERVRKLLALARDKGATEGERDNALRMAHATIAKYNLDMAECERDPSKRKAAEEEREFQMAQFFGRPWARQVAIACAELFFCEYMFMAATRAKETKHLFVGKSSNATTARLMAEWLVDAIMREGKKHQREIDGGNEAYRSFSMGAALRIRDRVREIRLAAEDASKALAASASGGSAGTAIVLASVYATERQANRALIEQRYPVRRTGRSGKSAEISSMAAGAKYGDKVNLTPHIK